MSPSTELTIGKNTMNDSVIDRAQAQHFGKHFGEFNIHRQYHDDIGIKNQL